MTIAVDWDVKHQTNPKHWKQSDLGPYYLQYRLHRNIYTASNVKHHLNIFQRQFSYTIYFERTINCNILLPKYFFCLSNLSECHLTILLKFYGVLYTPTSFWGYSDPKVLPLNLHYYKNIPDLFFRLMPKWFWRTQGFLSVTEIFYHVT